MHDANQETAKTPRVGRCVLEARVAELAAVTDVKTIDLTAFYTIADVCDKLKCDARTLKRRHDRGQAPWLVLLLGLHRCPAFLFWSWVADEVSKQLAVRP